MNLQTALMVINQTYDAQINAKAQLATTKQSELDDLISEKAERIRAVHEYVDAEADKIRIDAILANKPPELT